MIKLIVGLGNPGSKYDQTRHNAGFWFVDEVARRANETFRAESRFSGEACKVALPSGSVWLLKPTTFMNRSGLAVRQMCDFYKIPITEVLVAHDELDIPPGAVKFKRAGGHGGHNGLRDIIAHLGKDFFRLRLGVGHPGHKDQVVDFVLNRPSKTEEPLIHQCILDSANQVDHLLKGDFEKVMRELHSR